MTRHDTTCGEGTGKRERERLLGAKTTTSHGQWISVNRRATHYEYRRIMAAKSRTDCSFSPSVCVCELAFVVAAVTLLL